MASVRKDWLLTVSAVCLLIVSVHVVASRAGTSRNSNHKLLLILVDGCRWDYPDQDPSLVGFRRLAKNGVRASYTVPVYPSNSYPNWYTLVTGLYAESHGFVQNMMYDSEYNDFFLMAPNDTASVPHWWDGAEPLWVTAEKSGLRSALYWWDGCQVLIRNRKPAYCRPYKYVGTSWPTVDADTKEVLLTALELFDNDEINLVQVYYEPVDFNGHRFGPNSEERKQAVKNIDSLLDMLQTKMENRKLEDKVNIVVVSDHGMKATDAQSITVINLQQYIDVSLIRYMIYSGASCMLLPHDGKLEEIYNGLKGIPGLRVYHKAEIPERYHLKNNRLTLPLLLVASKNYYIQGLDIPGKSIPTGSSISLGSHGYDPQEVTEMRGIFFARGPSFKKGYISQPLQNVDIYNMLCESLGIEPLPNNGSTSHTKGIQLSLSGASPKAANQLTLGTVLSAVLVCLSVLTFITKT